MFSSPYSRLSSRYSRILIHTRKNFGVPGTYIVPSQHVVVLLIYELLQSPDRGDTDMCAAAVSMLVLLTHVLMQSPSGSITDTCACATAVSKPWHGVPDECAAAVSHDISE